MKAIAVILDITRFDAETLAEIHQDAPAQRLEPRIGLDVQEDDTVLVEPTQAINCDWERIKGGDELVEVGLDRLERFGVEWLFQRDVGDLLQRRVLAPDFTDDA